jgi:hypothetical protein
MGGAKLPEPGSQARLLDGPGLDVGAAVLTHCLHGHLAAAPCGQSMNVSGTADDQKVDAVQMTRLVHRRDLGAAEALRHRLSDSSSVAVDRFVDDGCIHRSTP